MRIYVVLYSCALSSCVCLSVYLCLGICMFVLSCLVHKVLAGSRWAGGGQRVARSKGEQRRTKVNWKLCEASPSDFIHIQFKASRLPLTNIKFIGRVLLPFSSSNLRSFAIITIIIIITNIILI